MTPRIPRLPTFLALPAGIWLFWTLLQTAGLLTPVDRMLLDPVHRARAARAEHPDPALIVAEISPAGLKTFGSLPWSPELSERLLLPMLEGGAERVGIAMGPGRFFDGPVPESLIPWVEQGRLILARPESELDSAYLRLDPDACIRLTAESYGRLTGLFLSPDADGRIRRIELGRATPCGTIPGLEQSLAGGAPIAAKVQLDGRAGSDAVFSMPVDKVLNGEVGPRFFAGRVVLIGTVTGDGIVIPVPSAPGGLVRDETMLRALITASLVEGLEPRRSGLPFLFMLLIPMALLGWYLPERSPRAALGAVAGAAIGVYAVTLVFELFLPWAVSPAAGPAMLVSIWAWHVVSVELAVYEGLRDLVAKSRGIEPDEPPRFRDWNELAQVFARNLSARSVLIGRLRQTGAIDAVTRNKRTLPFEVIGWYKPDRKAPEMERFRMWAPGWQLIAESGAAKLLPTEDWSGPRPMLAVPLRTGDVDAVVLADVEDARAWILTQQPRLRTMSALAARRMSPLPAAPAASTALLGARADILLHELGRRISTMHGNRRQAESALNSLPSCQLLADALGTIHLVTGRPLSAFGRVNTPTLRGAQLVDTLTGLCGLPESEVLTTLDRCRQRSKVETLRWTDPDAPSRVFAASIHPVRDRGDMPAEFPETATAGKGFPSFLHHGFVVTVNDISGQEDMERAVSSVVEAMANRAKTHLMVLQWGLELSGKLEKHDPKMFESLQEQVGALRQLFNLFYQGVAPDESTGRRRLPVDLAQMVRRAASFSSLPGEHVERLELDIPEMVSPVLVDMDILGKVLRGLLMDSLDSSSGNSKTRVEVRELVDEVTVEIHDDGYGIPQYVVDNVMDAASRELDEGSGLPAAASSIEQAGGRFEIESRPSEGTTYRMVFPKTPTLL